MARGRSGGMRASAPTPRTVRSAPRPAARPVQTAPVPAQAAPSAPMMAPQQQGPGLMGQMAATAGGVAIGSAVGHTIGHAMTGMFSGGSSEAAAAPVAAAAAPQQQYAPQQSAQSGAGGACAWEIKQFLQCAEQQSDITLCQGFNEALRQCKMSNGMQL
ncbi:coiled-coil-helix-coiled-coil-helix domain-containing protein 2 [Belonocnema kinseyi]|uniref:coiled-coil-helix-coiled-coil-helix domain-containing protein 2 n=1 Tax=Belonocnema kinseyi TaxID=2817044 RepID=UPI00143DE648|nr:coiled-coil-helix-coiled-coil-helix domain-containing protein 2 [Belonocnema kinseyi]